MRFGFSFSLLLLLLSTIRNQFNIILFMKNAPSNGIYHRENGARCNRSKNSNVESDNFQ